MSLGQKRFEFLDSVRGFDYVVRQTDLKDFSEFVISVGGDIVTYRVYGDSEDNFECYCS